MKKENHKYRILENSATVCGQGNFPKIPSRLYKELFSRIYIIYYYILYIVRCKMEDLV